MNIHGDGDGANNIGDGVVVEGKYLPKIDDQRTERAVQIEAAPQISQQRPQGPGVCWERFLHLRSLKVLLVENDASTRQIVAALLRNCSYEVIEATNGLQAWGILEDLTNDVDLVLTEVVMPCISGVALLCKIMSHKTRKNTPVIMMSSLDSMDLVFKCLSRGAIDFLVKPIRKNELKNLWQHVWRSCQSSSGSGSDSAMQTQKCVKSNSAERSVNNTGSNDEEGNWSIGLNLGDRSDKGSGNQGSLTKQAAEVNGPQSVAPWDQIAACTNTIGAPATHSNAATFKLVSVTATGEERLAAMPRELNIGAPGTPDTRPVDPIEDSLKLLAGQRNQPEIYSDKIGDKIFRGRMNLSDETSPNKLEGKPARLRGTITDTESPQMNHKEFKAATTSSNLETNNRVTNGTNDSPFHEFSLKKLRGLTDTGATVQDDHNILRHSDLSDFSRDNTPSNAKGPFGSIKNVSSNGNSSEALKKLPVHDTSSHSSGEVSNYHCPKQGNPKERTVESLHPAAFFQSVGDGSIYAHQKVVTERACHDIETVAALAQSQSGANQQELQIQDPHHQYDHQHHLDHNMQQLQQLPHNQHNFSLKEMLTIAAHCGSSSMLGGVIDGNAGNCSMNGNASSRREAALTKFHLKKKERCIQKKVQYQNKKRLAEEHPQIQGQFVRQKLHGNASVTSDR